MDYIVHKMALCLLSASRNNGEPMNARSPWVALLLTSPPATETERTGAARPLSVFRPHLGHLTLQICGQVLEDSNLLVAAPERALEFRNLPGQPAVFAAN